MCKKRISVSQKRQITIPIEFYQFINYTAIVECLTSFDNPPKNIFPEIDAPSNRVNIPKRIQFPAWHSMSFLRPSATLHFHVLYKYLLLFRVEVAFLRLKGSPHDPQYKIFENTDLLLCFCGISLLLL